MARKLKLPKERTFKGPALVWKRILAFIADMMIINLTVVFPFKGILRKSIPDFANYTEAYKFLTTNPSYVTTLTSVSIIMAVFVILYFSLLESKLMQTPGKMIFNIYVEGEKGVSFLQGVVRSLFVIPIFPFFLLWIVDPLFMMFTKTNQRLSEILSKTKTVQTYNV